MPTNFTPNSIIHIGRVPFDNSYAHTMTFASPTAQAEFYLINCMTQVLTHDKYTYVRMNNAIRVPFNAESLYTYNYVMYKNANYGDKWFYAFIVAVNYVNENMTELVLELDVMQTWYFDYDLEQCFVEREHVNDDTWGAHLNPEPSMSVEYIHTAFVERNMLAGRNYICMMVSQMPKVVNFVDEQGNPQQGYKGSTPVSGGLYQNQYSACNILLFKTWETGQIDCFKAMVNAMNLVGAGEAIVDCFTVPGQGVLASDITAVNFSNEITFYELNQGASPTAWSDIFQRPTSLDGYTPHNNKCLTYPYAYLELGDYSGRTQELKLEFFTYDGVNNRSGRLEEHMCGISDGVGYVIPVGYDGIAAGTNLDSRTYAPFTFNFMNKIPWTYSAYLNWMAQNAMVNQMAILGSMAALSIGLGTGLAGFAGMRAGTAALEAVSTKSARAAATASMHRGESQIKSGIQGVVGGAGGMMGTFANIDRMSRIPAKASGNTEGNSKYQNGYAGWYRSIVTLRHEFAEIVDKFFDMYGYQVDLVKVPNRTGRRSWNYVKTANADMHGDVPAEDMARINAIYNAGITFWHTSDIGNYSLTNDIV